MFFIGDLLATGLASQSTVGLKRTEVKVRLFFVYLCKHDYINIYKKNNNIIILNNREISITMQFFN